MRIISGITDFIFVNDEPHASDIIFIPGGSHPELGERAAELWKAGFAPLTLPAGGVSVKSGKFHGPRSKTDIYSGQYQTDCEFLADVLVKNGVSPEAILGEDQSGYTKENAFFSRKVTDEKNLAIKKAILVCKSFHARRALMCYQLAFPEAELYVNPVDCYGISRDNWYDSEYGIQRVLGELMRCGNQFNAEILQLMGLDQKGALPS